MGHIMNPDRAPFYACLKFSPTGVVIGFETPEYTVTEGEGSIEVCVVIVEGTLQRQVTVTVSTSDFSALGKSREDEKLK